MAAALALFLIMPAAQAAEESDAGKTCLWTYQIDYTDVPDERTIVFHMKGGEVWTSKLPRRCPGIRFHGFSYVVRGNDQLCGGLDSIRVLKTGSVCQLGPFERNAPTGAAKPTD
jgi:hypothetical protein